MKPIELQARNDMRAAVEQMKRHLPELIEYAKLQAKIRKAHYDALLAEGFTAEQAIELCKAVMP